MSNIENCKTVDELRKYSMQELSSLYSKIVKAHAPKFSDKGVAAKRILPLLEQKRHEFEIFPGTKKQLDSLTIRGEPKLVFVDPPKDLSKIIKVRGRPSGQLANRIYHFDFSRFLDVERQLPPQACGIIRSLMKQDEQTTWTEGDLPAAIEVKTKQNPWRIFQYYRPKLLALKVLRVENAS